MAHVTIGDFGRRRLEIKSTFCGSLENTQIHQEKTTADIAQSQKTDAQSKDPHRRAFPVPYFTGELPYPPEPLWKKQYLQPTLPVPASNNVMM